MENKTIIKIQTEDGKVQDAEVVLFFSATDTKQKYLIYTLGEKDGEFITTYTAKVKEDENGNIIQLEGVTDDAEWNKIKDIMRDIITSGAETETTEK
jgi:uncharacterized protein YrzB (UPF0473 family)